MIGVRHEIVNESGAPVSPLLYYQLVRDGNPPPGGSSLYFTFTGPAIYTDVEHYKKIDFSAIEKREGDKVERVNATSGWVAMVQHYFVSAWLLDTPRTRAAARVLHRQARQQHLLGRHARARRHHRARRDARRSMPASSSARRRRTSSPALAPGLELVKDYGWFTILAKPLFWLLTQLHKLIGNWGWSIVGLVVLLKIAFFWLNAKAYGSMAKMKAINPRIMEMRERLKDKPQQMQQEMMRIYREEKVNPLGGCLPIFVQMPFFIALYWVLLSTVEMRERALDRLDPRPVGEGPVLHPAAADDGHQPAADLAQSDAARPGAGADDVDHAAGLLGDVLLLPGRPGAVLADEQHPVDRAAVADQQAARRARQVALAAPSAAWTIPAMAPLHSADPIVAIATAPGRGAVGIVRVSGAEPVAAGRRRSAAARSAAPGDLLPFLDAAGAPIDQGLAIHFPAPHSYTGEDVLELQAHGGPVVLQLLLARCLEAAAPRHGRRRSGCAWPSRASSRSAPSSTTSSTWRRPRPSPT